MTQLIEIEYFTLKKIYSNNEDELLLNEKDNTTSSTNEYKIEIKKTIINVNNIIRIDKRELNNKHVIKPLSDKTYFTIALTPFDSSNQIGDYEYTRDNSNLINITQKEYKKWFEYLVEKNN